jgi:hypothetical protein
MLKNDTSRPAGGVVRHVDPGHVLIRHKDVLGHDAVGAAAAEAQDLAPVVEHPPAGGDEHQARCGHAALLVDDEHTAEEVRGDVDPGGVVPAAVDQVPVGGPRRFGARGDRQRGPEVAVRPEHLPLGALGEAAGHHQAVGGGQTQVPAAGRAAAGHLGDHPGVGPQVELVAAEAAWLEGPVETRLQERLVRVLGDPGPLFGLVLMIT